MAQIVSRAQAATLIGSAINETWTSSGEAISPLFKRYLKEKKSPHSKYVSYQAAFPANVALKPEGSPIGYDDYKFGTALTIEPDTYAIGVRFTKEALQDIALDPYGDFSSAKLISASAIGTAFREACNQKMDVLATQIIESAQSATATASWVGAGWDGKALAAADHPILSNTSILGGTTYSNVGAASSLSQSTLQTMLSSMETIPTLEGLVRPLGMKYLLVVGPALRMTAYTAVQTAKKNKLAGSFDNDVPGLSDFDIEVFVNPFMGASSTKYALIGPNAKLHYWMRQPPEIEDERDFETKGHKWSVDFRFKVFHNDSHDFFHSAGA